MNVKPVNLRQINNWLTLVVIGLGLYITLIPWWPRIGLWIKQRTDDTHGFVYRGELSANQAPDEVLAPPPENNTLVIPAIGIDEKVVEGRSLGVIGNGGVWRRPNTSTPDKGGNTVIIGHRFTYDGQSTFFNLDQVAVGDKFAVWWQNQEYVYEVFEVKVVPATAVEIEGNTADPILTLYTCTPVWTAKDRLVIVAKLVNTEVLKP
jgi:LPXTG-site transpeptidase (sortase) family protein